MTQDQKSRAAGVVFLVCGALLGYLAIWRPYQEALRGVPTVALNRTGIAMAILFPIAGLILATLGESASAHLRQHVGPTKTRRGWAYMLVIGAVALATFFIVERRFEALGYTM